MEELVVLLLVFLILHLCVRVQSSSWSQQYGDPHSSSYTDYVGGGFQPGWNYTTQPFVSQTSPCVDGRGTIYYPLRAHVAAISANGSSLWTTGVSPNGNSYLTNILFSEEHGLVIVGSSWVEGDLFFQIVAVSVEDGSILWVSKQDQVFHATTMSLSVHMDSVYVAGYDQSSFIAVRLADGKLIWEEKHIYQVGLFMQTKVGQVGSGWSLEESPRDREEVVLLPTDPWNGFEGNGRLFAYSTGEGTGHISPRPKLDWCGDFGFTAGALFAFSNVGILYGSNGGSEGSQGALFFISSLNGSLLYTNDGYCDRGPAGISGPAVDGQGFVYFSCGNQVFSLKSDGSLRWMSKKFGNSSLGSVTPTSIHPEGFLFFIHQNGTVVYRLATKDGSTSGTYIVPQLGYFEPPILVSAILASRPHAP